MQISESELWKLSLENSQENHKAFLAALKEHGKIEVVPDVVEVVEGEDAPDQDAPDPGQFPGEAGGSPPPGQAGGEEPPEEE